jgi:hypothetical protein
MGFGGGWTALAVALAVSEPAQAATDGEAPALDVVGGCPDAAVVRGLLGALLSPDEARGAAVSIRDEGARYRIAVGETATTLGDPGRDCAARARQAAVVVANELRSHPTILGPPLWTIEKGLVFEVAPGAAGAASSWGAEFRGAYGSGLWSVVGAAGARGPVTLTFEEGWKAELLRFPLDAGARITMRRWRLRPWLALGPSLVVKAILGENLVETDREWRLDVGGTALAGATLPLFKRIGVAAALAVRWEPRPYRLDVVPVGRVGETPVWWLGLSLNYTIDGSPGGP